MKEKKSSLLWNILVIALVLTLVIIVGVAVAKNNSNTGNSEGSSNSQTDTGSESIGDSESSQDSQTENGGQKETDSEPAVTPEPVPQGDGSETFVMFGVDSRSDQLGKGTRSDSIMLINVNHDSKQVKVVSIYRDCMLYQEGKGYKKISNAHSYGGPEYAVSVLNENFDLAIKDYCTVNFNAVGDLIDQVGGVQMDITAAEIKYINDYIDQVNGVRGTSSAHITEPGTYTLDGTQAVAYSRIRYTAGSDYKRTERQRTVLFKVFEKSKAMKTEERLEVVDKLLGEINTSYSQDELLVLIYYMSEYEITTMTAYPKVFYGGSVDGSWVEVPVTLIDMNKDLHKVLLGETDYTPSARVEQISQALRNKVSGANIDQRDDGE